MQQTKVYTSKKKTILLLLFALVFVAGGSLFIIYPEKFTNSSFRSPFIIRIVGVIGVLFFGFALFTFIKRLIKPELALLIDENGITIKPEKSNTKLSWNEISGISETKVNTEKFIAINVKNPEKWIDNEKKLLKRKTLEFNNNNYGSPFCISARGLEKNHTELISLIKTYIDKN